MATIKWYNPDTDEWEYVGVGSSGGGSGDVVGPSSSTDDAIARYSGTTGKLLDQPTFPATISDGGLLGARFMQAAGIKAIDDDYGVESNVISEYTDGSGVTIDGVLVKDGLVDGKDVSTLTSNTGDVVGPASSTNNTLAMFDGTGGKTLKNGLLLLDSSTTPYVLSPSTYGHAIDISGNAIGGPASLSGGVIKANNDTPAATINIDGTDRQIVSTSGTQTLSSKRVNPRVISTTSASSLTPDISSADQYCYTALAANLTINAPAGTPVDGNKLLFRIKDNGTSRTLTWNSAFRVIGVTLPTATTVSKTHYVGCVYNAADTKWDVIAVATET